MKTFVRKIDHLERWGEGELYNLFIIKYRNFHSLRWDRSSPHELEQISFCNATCRHHPPNSEVLIQKDILSSPAAAAVR